MPRILIEVNEDWLTRLELVIPAAIDCLTGWNHLIHYHETNGHQEAEDLLQILSGQIEDLKRNIESIRIIF